MAVKSIDRTVGCSLDETLDCGFDSYEADDPYGFETGLEDSEPAIWPRGDGDSEDLPPAQGRCRRVSHDW
jgi:hypothetical protein